MDRTADVPREPPTKLALILSGAVSLGSFEAGVLTELLYALDHLAAGATPCVLDVVTGASAGSMTAALVARALMNDFADRRLLHDAWVERIDIRELVRDLPTNAFLSKAPIERIATDFLLERPLTTDRRARFAPATLRMSFTLSNMCGVDYEIPDRLGEGEKFTSTFYAERRRFTMDDAAARALASWRAVKEAAVASGNFPLAFAPAMVASSPESWPNRRLKTLPDEFCYVDGGVLNNEPIREAVQLALVADDGEIDDRRKFLLVDANLNHSAVTDFTATRSLRETVLRLAAVVAGESTANDWLKAKRVNQEIAWRDMLLDHLRHMVETNTLQEPEAFQAELKRTAAEIVETKRQLFPERYPADYLARALERTAARHEEKLAGLGPHRREMLATMIFVLNSIAGLDKKDALDIDVIYADPDQTAGDRLMSFGGFFDRRWREHDFRLGREKAHRLLPQILGVAEYPREGADRGEDLYTNPENYSHVELRDADPAMRALLRDTAAKRVEEMTEGFGFGPRWLHWASGPATRFVVGRFARKKIGEMLQL